MALHLPPPLTGPYATPPAADGLRPLPATVNLVRSQVKALLMASPGFHVLNPADQKRLADSMVKISAYAAELIRDDWYQSEQIGQRPVVRYRRTLSPVRANGVHEVPVRAAAADFSPAAASQIGRVTQETLRAIAFPTFVADLIDSTFNAIVNASIRQMEAFTRLLEDVSKTVEQFMNDNVTDNMARDWLAERYPAHLRVETQGEEARLTVREGAEDRPLPGWQRDLSLRGEIGLDEDAIEEILVPAARRKLAQNRMQMLSTLVLMGMNRIVVTGGKIRATMQFHIDTSDRAREERATDFDFRTAASGQFGMGWWSASASMSVAYVSSVRSESEAEMNVDANLTGEVEIHFKSDYFPLNRFAPNSTIAQIQAHTAVPEENTPDPSFAPQIEPLPGRRSPRRPTTLPPLRTAASPVLTPTAPTPVTRVSPPPNAPANNPETAPAQPNSATPASPATETTPVSTERVPAAGGPEVVREESEP
jgi:hypothetical protein